MNDADVYAPLAHGMPPRPRGTSWSDWRATPPSEQLTIGIEEELMLLDPRDLRDVAALAALVQSLARLELERPYVLEEELTGVELLEENRFLAARDGMDALFIDVASRERIPAVAQLELTLDACRDHAEQLGCEPELAALPLLAAQNGAARQIAHARDGDLQRVAAGLAGAYCEDLPAALDRRCEPPLRARPGLRARRMRSPSSI